MVGTTTDEEKKNVSYLMMLCKPLAVLAILLGLGILAYVFMSPTSPVRMGGKVKMSGGGSCACGM